MPQHIGHYVVEAPLGRGAMGTVYLARDPRIGRRVAIKQVKLAADKFEDSSAAAEFWKRLQREAEVCASMQHPNIVTLYDVGYEDDRISYLALEYVPGETLLDLLKRHRPGPIPLETALAVTADVLRGLAYAHDKGIVHRDIKPANILIAHEGTAKIADFGIARPQQSSLTMAGALMGTPNYMSPEQVTSVTATKRSDLFSLGVLLFEMVTGIKPFAANDLAVIFENIIRMPMPSAAAVNPEVTRQLDAYIQRLTAKAPEDRFATARDALDALERLGSPAAPQIQSPATLRRRIPPPVFLSIVLAAVLALALPVYTIWTRIDDRPTAVISQQQLAEFAQKREALRSADELFQKGQHAESLAAFEAYLAKYPHSTVAREGAERARGALEKPLPQKARKTPLMQDIKRSVKRLFRGN